MDKEWSEKNKKMQTLISKEATFSEGINLLLELRGNLFEQISSIVNTFPPEAFYQLPFGHGDSLRQNPGILGQNLGKILKKHCGRESAVESLRKGGCG
ncbi:MAG: hypothetical protein K6G00_09930 [Treponema sp.]|nr:hypothetical protein [Treponema sp.]